MGKAKEIHVRPLPASTANELCREIHYSGKIVPNSQIHLGAFYTGKLGGVMQFGPPMDRNRMAGVVKGTKPREMLELNRMAFADWLPRNGESRCISIALRMLRDRYPHIKWIVSFADGCQCGDGTIYRAAGFVLTNINKNKTLLRMPSRETINLKAVENEIDPRSVARFVSIASEGELISGKSLNDYRCPATGMVMTSIARRLSAKPLRGFQLRYIYFMHPSERENLAVDEIPFSEIEKLGARMYKGKRVGSIDSDAPADQAGEGGASPTSTLQPPQ